MPLWLVFPLLRLIEVTWVGPWSKRISVLTGGDLRDLSPETRLASAWVLDCPGRDVLSGSLSRREGRVVDTDITPLRLLRAGFLHLRLPWGLALQTAARGLCVHLTRTEQLGQ